MIEFEPGIVLDDSELASKNTFASGNLIRWRRGRAQPIGGWESATTSRFEDPARGAHAWASLSGDRVAAFGTASHLYSYYGGAIEDITPDKAGGTLLNPFGTEGGSDVVTVTDVDHGLAVEDRITYRLADTVGGLDLNGTYTVLKILTIDQYQIRANSSATATAQGGGNVEFKAPLRMGNINGVGGTGYGTGLYGFGAYGLPSGGDIYPLVWSVDNYGQNGVFVPRNGALYEWQPVPDAPELIGNNGFDDNALWSLGEGWTISNGKARATTGSLSAIVQNVTGNVLGGSVYSISFDVEVTTGSLQLRVESSDAAVGQVTLGEPIKKTGTYTRRFRAPQRPKLLGFVKNQDFAGTIDNVSLRIEEKAYRVQQAPAYSIGMFVDPNRLVVCYGTLEADGDYNPLLVRWSDQENLTEWIPETSNLSGEYLLANGSRIVGAIPTTGQNLIWTDKALYTMRFTGSSDQVFRFDLVGSECGLLGKNAAVEHQGMVFWWSNNGQFYIFEGGRPKVIPSTVRRDAWDNLAPSQQEKAYAAVNPEFNEIWWLYPDNRDGNECSRVVAYNWADGFWMTHRLPRTSWITQGENILAFSPDGRLYFQERGNTENGSPMQCSLRTGRFDLGDGDRLFRISRYAPDFEDQDGNVDVTLRFFGWGRGSAKREITKTVRPSTEAIAMMAQGRQAQIEWRSGTNFEFARWGAQRFDVTPTEARR